MAHVAAGAQEVRKQFGATTALDGVSFDVLEGEVHALVGENGAGKSTLVRILGGVHRPDQGRVMIDGREAHLASPRDAIAAGVAGGLACAHGSITPRAAWVAADYR